VAEELPIALVTGASSGLGAEFVRQLAPRCRRILAVARRGERLATLAAATGSCAVEPLVADLATVEGQARVVEAIRQCGPVQLLVNNAGFATFGPFAESTLDDELAMVRLHQEATLVLTRAVLPFMRAAGGGAIINVASLGAFLPLPGTAVYGASKAFLHAFSESLGLEEAGNGIRVQSLCPGLTHTEIHDRPTFAGFDKSRLPEALWMDAPAVVAESLGALDGAAAPLIPGQHNRARALEALERLRGSVEEQASQHGAVDGTEGD
jgi:short-subunit dehydrogenase